LESGWKKIEGAGCRGDEEIIMSKEKKQRQGDVLSDR
jgi:hypothetical protein